MSDDPVYFTNKDAEKTLVVPNVFIVTLKPSKFSGSYLGLLEKHFIR